jgi:16S rRNA (guanine(966)-N(2))-methyltransferase RsmD
MRIISGDLKGRRFEAPDNLPVRPTTDMAKESLFNILSNKISLAGITVLDLFAGIGGISMEFLSRGAISLTAVDINSSCIDFIRKTAAKFNVDNRLFAIKSDVFPFLEKNHQQFDVVFADPPYAMPNIIALPEFIFDKNVFKKNAIFVLEHSADYNFSENKHFIEERKYGKVHFSFFAS